MKKILITICAVFIAAVASADTLNVTWYNLDGTTYDTTTCTVGGTLTLPATPPTRYGYTFKGWVIYTPIEYIESTGTQYIDTGFSPNQDTRVVAKFMVPSSNNTGFIFGSRYRYDDRTFAFVYIPSMNAMRYDYANTINNGPACVFGQKMTVDLNKNKCDVYNNESGTNVWSLSVTYTNFQTPNNLVFPGIMTNGTYGTGDLAVRIYSFKIYDNNVLVRDLIPVLGSDGVACMYDKVENKFYYNAGAGNFIAGPAIQ